MKKALITGITGQDGSYLSEILLKNGYEVYGLVRRVAISDDIRFSRLSKKVKIYCCDITSYYGVYEIIKAIMPDELYHLAAQSFVKLSFEDEFQTYNVNCNGTNYVLSSLLKLKPECKFYFAASSEMFGNSITCDSESRFQDENTPFSPVSPYGLSKCFGYYLTKQYREVHGMYAVSGILFNHESERRGDEFVVKKITNYFSKLLKNDKIEHKLNLGNINAMRDWGYAPEYMEAVYMMMHNEKPVDYVVGTGKSYSIKDLIEYISNKYNIDCMKYINIDENCMRKSDINYLCANYRKIAVDLGWKPEKNIFDIIDIMMSN